MTAHDGNFRYEAKESAPHNSLDVTQQGQLDIVFLKAFMAHFIDI